MRNIIQPHFDFSVEEICEKDSREITDTEVEKLANSIRATSHENILVAHGTFTMATTAQYLDGLDLGAKKVVLTGSMIPIQGFAASDAGFNLGFVIGSFPHLEPGVYLSMNGRIFNPEDAEKNVEAFRFE